MVTFSEGNMYAVIAVAVILPIAVAVVCLITCCCWKRLSEMPQYEVKIPSVVSVSIRIYKGLLNGVLVFKG